MILVDSSPAFGADGCYAFGLQRRIKIAVIVDVRYLIKSAEKGASGYIQARRLAKHAMVLISDICVRDD